MIKKFLTAIFTTILLLLITLLSSVLITRTMLKDDTISNILNLLMTNNNTTINTDDINIEENVSDNTIIENIINEVLDETTIPNEVLEYFNKEEIKDNEPFKIPKNWKWCELEKICKKIYAGGDKTSKFSKNKTNDYKIPVIANGKENDGIIGYTDIPTETEKSLTISGRGTIGFSLVRNYSFSPVVRLIVIKPIDNINLNYLK